MTPARSPRAALPAIEVAGATDRGTVRAENQDVWATAPLGDGRIALILADGMGGHTGGREAAEAAVSAVVRRLEGAAAESSPGASGLLADAVERANAAVHGVRDNIGGLPGTTLVIAIVAQDSLGIANVGDSRAYLIREGVARPLTTDHTWVGEEVLAGRLPPGSERGHPRRNVLSRAVMGDAVAADVTSHPWQRGDLLLLCSDGVWEPLSEDRLAAAASAAEPLETVAHAVCQVALAAGSRDNVTVALARRLR